MTEHKLKIWTRYYLPVISGAKKFEYRRNDRNFQVGDTLCLEEVTDDACDYTGKRIYVYVTYIYECPDNWVIMSIEPRDIEK